MTKGKVRPHQDVYMYFKFFQLPKAYFCTTVLSLLIPHDIQCYLKYNTYTYIYLYNPCAYMKCVNACMCVCVWCVGWCVCVWCVCVVCVCRVCVVCVCVWCVCGVCVWCGICVWCVWCVCVGGDVLYEKQLI